jgi:MipA family protein
MPFRYTAMTSRLATVLPSLLATLLGAVSLRAEAQSLDAQPLPPAPAASAPASQALPQPSPAAFAATPPASKPAPKFEGAVGLILAYRPEFSGASRSVFKLSPGVFLRYGRFTLTNASGFATRRVDDVVPGLGVDLLRSERVRAGLSLRVDQGRGENSAGAFAGLGNVRPTLRARAGVSGQIQGPWRAGASWSVDLLGRQGGGFGDISAGWETTLSPHTKFSLGSALGVADARYLQTYYGISPEQASRTSYPVYQPKAGLRDASLYTNLRHDIGRDWILLAGASANLLLGSAAASPLTSARNGWALSVGAARQF